MLFVMYHIYKTNNTILIITLYRVISTVIILNIPIKIFNTYYLIRLLRIYVCFISCFEVLSIYNLMGLPFRLTFYTKVQFLITLNVKMIVLFVLILTVTILYIIKYITKNVQISKKIFILLILVNIII